MFSKIMIFVITLHIKIDPIFVSMRQQTLRPFLVTRKFGELYDCRQMINFSPNLKTALIIFKELMFYVPP